MTDRLARSDAGDEHPPADKETVAWLLASTEPAVAHLTRRDLLGEPHGEPGAAGEAAPVNGPVVEALLAGQDAGGGFGGHPYRKWGGAHWRLVSLVELGIAAGEPRAVAALDTVLAWLTGASHRSNVPVVAGLTRRCASQEGNALAVACRLGCVDDPRTELLARSLVAWQWPDGGWNCDVRPEAHRSSFHESLPPMWGLHEYAVATGDHTAAAAAGRTAELLLDHRLFKATATGKPIHPSFRTLHWPLTGTTTPCRPWWCWLAWVVRANPVVQTASSCSRNGEDRTPDGVRENAGGRRRVARAHPRLSTGARRRSTIKWSPCER